MLPYGGRICLLSHTGPIPASWGGEPFSGTTAALPHCCGPGFACLISAAEPAPLLRGLQKAVGPDGRVIGIDRDEVLLELARTERASIPEPAV